MGINYRLNSGRYHRLTSFSREAGATRFLFAYTVYINKYLKKIRLIKSLELFLWPKPIPMLYYKGSFKEAYELAQEVQTFLPAKLCSTFYGEECVLGLYPTEPVKMSIHNHDCEHTSFLSREEFITRAKNYYVPT